MHFAKLGSEGHNLSEVVKTFALFSTFFAPFSKMYLVTASFMKIKAGKATCFSQCEVNFIYVCATKPHDILNVKKALVKSACYVTKYSICNFFERLVATLKCRTHCRIL